MGIRRKLDSLMRKGFNTSKFKGTVNLAISRLAILKNQRQARGNVARSDVVEFLSLGYHERALLRVEQVIKEQNMLDVYVLLEGYCHLLIERVSLIEQEKECPDELVEAASSLIYAASRCGDFPELQEIRKIFSSHYGKDFVARAVELRNKCGVNPKIIQKFSTKMPTLESKMKVLQDIATDHNIVMPNETTAPPIVLNLSPHHENEDSRKGNRQSNSKRHDDHVEEAVDFTESPKLRVKYRDVAHAAQAAFESAAYAAAAARAAVKLSQSESTDPDDPDTPNHQPRKLSSATFHPTRDEKDSLEDEQKIENVHRIQSHDWVPETENKTGYKRSLEAENIKEMETSSEEGNIDSKPLAKDVVFDQSDDENDEVIEGSGNNHSTVKYYPLRTGAGFKTEPNSSASVTRTESVEPLNINRRPISVRTKWRQGLK